MKKYLLSLVIVFLLFSCDTGNMDNETNEPNPFIGTWENENVHYVISPTEITVIIKSNSNKLWDAAAYTYDGIHLFVYTDDRTTIAHYVFKDDKLIITGESISAILNKTA